MRTALSLLFALIVALPTSLLAAPSLEAQRDQFRAAAKALDQGQLDDFWRIAATLEGYPLYPYLQFDYLRTHLKQTDDATVAAFIHANAGGPLERRMRYAWLVHLAKEQRWGKYAEVFDKAERTDTELNCHYLHARIAARDIDAALWREVDGLWLVGKSQPDACNPVFDAWRAAGQMSSDKIRGRIELAMDGKQISLARWLGRSLTKGEQDWLARWIKVYDNPKRELPQLPLNKESPMAAAAFAYGVRWLARRDLNSADQLWQQRRDHYRLSREQRNRTERTIALYKAYRRDPDASARLAALMAVMPDADDDVRHWRIRSALWQQAWPAVLEGIAALPAQERDDSRWTYWRGRAFEALGRHNEARTEFTRAAADRSYYGFLSAEQIGQPPAISAASVTATEGARRSVAALPAMQRVSELMAVDRVLDARREWRDATLQLTGTELRAAAEMGQTLGWHDLVIMTIAKTEAIDDLELRFPLPFRATVVEEAKAQELDDAFVYAVMRQESAFNAAARSRAGALGLMQLMPATARLTARQIKYQLSDMGDLLVPRHNLRLGTAHLKHLLERYNGNRVFTMAAYNAGPGRVTRWLPSSGQLPADIWISGITFDETREYVKRILAYTTIYEWRLGRQPTPLSQMLPLVQAATEGEGTLQVSAANSR